MRLGPESVCEKLEELSRRFEFAKEPSIEFLLNHKDRVEDLHRVALVHSIKSDMQIVVSFFSEGQIAAGITLSDPFSRSPSPYRMSVDPQIVSKLVGEIFGWGVSEIRSGIFEFPPRVKFLAVIGPDIWMKKELFQEKIKGDEKLSFAERIDEEVFERILNLKKSSYLDGINVFIDDEGIHIAFSAPDGIDNKRIPLLSEMAKLVREKFGVKTSIFSKVSKGKRVFATATFSLENLWKEDPLSDAKEMMNRILDGYRAFLREAGLD